MIRLNGEQYKALQKWVLERDDYACQICDRATTAPPHHIVYRSQGGEDVANNMVCTCQYCHHDIHHGNQGRVIRRLLQRMIGGEK